MTDSLSGLSAAEAERRLASEGPNELPQPAPRTFMRVVIDVLREPMFALLLAGGGIYLAVGDTNEALMLMLFATLSVSIAVGQDLRSGRVLEALRNLASPRALVVRGGQRLRIPGREVVRGDILIVADGDRVAADAVLREQSNLQLDESILTGESIPVSKATATHTPTPLPAAGGGDLPVIYAGTLVTAGHGVAEAVATGRATQVGAIGSSLESITPERPRTEVEIRRLVRIWALLGLGASLGATLLYGFLRGGWLDAILAGIALGMSMLPEEFPLVFTVFMVMGAWRISRARVLTRRASAIEFLGAASVLCTDKTGTLTKNTMQIAALATLTAKAEVTDATQALPGELADIVLCGLHASPRAAFDPMERAFHAFGAVLQREDAPGRNPIRTYPLRPGLMAMSQVWPVQDGMHEVACKGATEAVARLCRMSTADADRVDALANDMAGRGMRVLGVARAKLPADVPFPSDHLDVAFSFVGLVGLSDPLRDEVPEAIEECRSAGIRVVMITGDYPATASAIAKQAGLAVGTVLTGAEVDALDDAALARALGQVSVCARIAPLQKLRIVNAFKANGEVVAMTGDGVNDAPSLKAADIGVAMGGRGTDVARESASIVLLDDDFTSIVRTIRLGRRIYDNLRKAIIYIMAVHIPIAALALLPLLLGTPLLFYPVHIAFLEMIIDPVCSIAFEAEHSEKDVMQRPPRPRAQHLFTPAMIAWSLLQGFVALAFVGALYFGALWNGMAEQQARAMAFVGLVAANAGLILANRSFHRFGGGSQLRANYVLWSVLGLVGLILSIVLLWPPACALFQFARLELVHLMLALGAGLAVLALLETLKGSAQKRMNAQPVVPGA